MQTTLRMGLVWHGDPEARANSNLEQSRFAGLAEALRREAVEPEAVVYCDALADEVEAQILGLDAVQVWVNPIEGDTDRTRLDSLLCRVAAKGVLVNTHPDTILKMGTKQVLVDTRSTSFGSDVEVYLSLAELKEKLPARLAQGPQVLKQHRGHSGRGIWKFAPVDGSPGRVLLRHAQRGAPEEEVTFDEAVQRMAPYFSSQGKMYAQPFQERLVEGMIRVYMVEGTVGGFGHQAVNALFPAPKEDPLAELPLPGPRLYYPPEEPRFQDIRSKMESAWLPELKNALGLAANDLPLLWDADFLFGPKDAGGNDTYVLCEINVSCVSPYPEWANPLIATTAARRIAEAKGTKF